LTYRLINFLTFASETGSVIMTTDSKIVNTILASVNSDIVPVTLGRVNINFLRVFANI